MQKRNFAVSVTVALFAIVLLGLTGCKQDQNGVASPEASIDNSGSTQYNVADFEDALNSVQDATLETDMSVVDFPPNGIIDRNGPFMNKFRPDGLRPDSPGRNLGKIFRQLTLTDVQKDSLKTLLGDARECQRAAFEDFRNAIDTILQRTREQRRDILDSVKSGAITREQARDQIKQMDQDAREAIQNNPDAMAAKEELCNCKMSLFDNIRAILDAEQVTIWDEWVAGLPSICD